MEVRAMVRMNALREATGMFAIAYCVSLSVRRMLGYCGVGQRRGKR